MMATYSLASDYESIQSEDIKCLNFRTHIVVYNVFFSQLSFPPKAASKCTFFFNSENNTNNNSCQLLYINVSFHLSRIYQATRHMFLRLLYDFKVCDHSFLTSFSVTIYSGKYKAMVGLQKIAQQLYGLLLCCFLCFLAFSGA